MVEVLADLGSPIRSINKCLAKETLASFPESKWIGKEKIQLEKIGYKRANQNNGIQELRTRCYM